MTCIVAVVKEGKAWIGGDSASVGGLGLIQRSDPKVFEKNGFLFGFTSSWRMGQILRYRFDPPRRHSDDDLMAYMATEFIDSVRACLKDYGFAKIDNNVEEGGTFLVVVDGRIFQIEGDFQVGESVHPFDACGCGEDIARGALHAMHGAASKIVPEVMVQRALEAAEAFSAGVRSPFKVISSA